MTERPYLSICGIYRDEAPYLREWVEFHRLVGVERFFLYNNSSRDEHREALAPYVENRIVKIHEWPIAHRAQQLPAYHHCLESHRDDSRWIAFLDIDEFLFSPAGLKLPEVLVEYERWPGLGVNWAIFGTSGHRTKPRGLVIENYLWRSRESYEDNRLVKSIVDPRRVAWGESIHHFRYRDGSAMDENHCPIEGWKTESVSFSRLRLNHYWTKSEQEWRRKLSRRRVATGKTWRPVRGDPNFMSIDALLSKELDETITVYVPALREALARPGSLDTDNHRPLEDPGSHRG